jgi:hypothetical protein
MGVIQFRIGRRHGRENKPYLIHRNSIRYDGASDNDSYLNGYKYGLKERSNPRVTHTNLKQENTND